MNTAPEGEPAADAERPPDKPGEEFAIESPRWRAIVGAILGLGFLACIVSILIFFQNEASYTWAAKILRLWVVWVGLAVASGVCVMLFLRWVRPRDPEEPWKRPILAGAGVTGLIAALMAVPTLQDPTQTAGGEASTDQRTVPAAPPTTPTASPTEPRYRGDPPPFTAQLDIAGNPEGCEGFAVGRDSTKSLPSKRADFNAKWAHDRGSGTTSKTGVVLFVEGESNKAVILRSMEIVDVERRPVEPSAVVLTTCTPEGGIVVQRFFDVTFGRDRARLTSRPGTDPFDKANFDPAVKFPFRISESDPEVFVFMVRGADCVCSWRIAINWSSGTKSGQLLADRDGSKIVTDTRNDLPIHWWREDGKIDPPLPD